MDQSHLYILLLCFLIILIILYTKPYEPFIFVKMENPFFNENNKLLDLTKEINPFERGLIHGKLMKDKIIILSKQLCPSDDLKNFIKYLFNTNIKHIPASFLDEMKGISAAMSPILPNENPYNDDVIILNYIFDVTYLLKNSNDLTPDMKKSSEKINNLFFPSQSWATYNSGDFSINLPSDILSSLIVIKRSEFILDGQNIRQSFSLSLPGSVGAFSCMSYDQGSNNSLFVSCNQVQSLAVEIYKPGIGMYNLTRFLCFASTDSNDCINTITSTTRGFSAIYQINDALGNSSVLECLPWNTNDFIFGFNPLKYVPGPVKGFFPSEYRLINETTPYDYMMYGSRRGVFIRRNNYIPTILTILMNDNFSKQTNQYKSFQFIVPKNTSNVLVANNDFVYPLPRINQIQSDVEGSQERFDNIYIDKKDKKDKKEFNVNVFVDMKDNSFKFSIGDKESTFNF